MERLSHTIGRIREHAGAWLRIALILVVLFAIFFVAGGGVSHNKKWQIAQVHISGTDLETSNLIRALAREKMEGNYYFVYARNNSYLFPDAEIEQTITDIFPRIASVVVKRIDNHTIDIAVVEREPYALWCGVDTDNQPSSNLIGCWFVDATGFVFDKAPIFSRGVYAEVYGELIETYEGETLRSTLPRERFSTARTFQSLIEKSVGEPLQIYIKPDNEFVIVIASSVQFPFLAHTFACFKDDSHPDALIKNLLSAIPVQFPEGSAPKKKLLYIDMRFNNKVIFGFDVNASSTCKY